MDIHCHPLALTDKSSSRKHDCIVCYEPSSQLNHGCRCCDFYVNAHKSCSVTKIPKVLHHSHFHDCHLRRSHGSFTCNACQKYRTGLCYELSVSGSDFKLNVRCAYLKQPLIIFDGHSHPLIFLMNSNGRGMCNACGKPCTLSVFHCLTCSIKLHLSCCPLPCSIKQETHIDMLVLKDSLVEDVTGDDEFYCDSCEERRDPHECIYYCFHCCYYCAEIKCVCLRYASSSI